MEYVFNGWLILFGIHFILNLFFLFEDMMLLEGGKEPRWLKRSLSQLLVILILFRSVFTFFIQINDQDKPLAKKVKLCLHWLDGIILVLLLLMLFSAVVLPLI